MSDKTMDSVAGKYFKTFVADFMQFGEYDLYTHI